MTTANGAIGVADLCRRLQGVISTTPGVQNVWVVGETSDLRVSGGHCYLELLDKDEQGNTTARIRANIWASTWRAISASFAAATGMQLASGMKIMARVSANFHPVYGIAVVISAVDASYTMGEAVRRRNEILARLQHDGIMMMNRELTWGDVPLRIAIISASGAAGYGDFVNQLFSNTRRFNFRCKLFPAVMQGERTVPTVIAALDAVADSLDQWDCVVIIRGGGSTSDLQAFDNYELAAHVAQFPLPVIVGIGHERDVTVLDYVANLRVKTPTAAAEWLIAAATSALTRVENVGAQIYTTVIDRINGNERQLAYLSALIPGAINTALTAHRGRLSNLTLSLASMGPRHLAPRMARLEMLAEMVKRLPGERLTRGRQRLDALGGLVQALSPDAVLKRGFSLTTDDEGRVLTSVGDARQGQKIITRLADGSLTSVVE